jgi:hypothetical protein
LIYPPYDRGSPRAEQTFFDNPVIDRFFGSYMALAIEHHLLSDRVRMLENALKASGALPQDALTQERTAEERQVAGKAAAELTERLLKPLLGVQDALGPPNPTTLREFR